MPTASTKLARIKKHFAEGHSLTHLECSSLFATHRLCAYVHILRHQHNMNIKDERKVSEGESFYIRYWLHQEKSSIET